MTDHIARCSPQINEHWSEGVILKELQSLFQTERTTIIKPASNNYLCTGKLFQEQYYTIRI